MLAAAFTAWVVGVAVQPCLRRRPTRANLRDHAAAADRARRGGRGVAIADLGAPRLAVDHRCGRTRSSAARSSTSRPLGADRLPQPADLASNSPAGAGEFARFVAAGGAHEPPGASAGCSAMFLNQGPITISVLVLVIGSRSGCSGRAGDSARGPSASIPGPPRRSASTSSALRYRNVILGGVFAGLAGAFLTLEADELIPAEHDRRARLHRPRGDDHRVAGRRSARSARRSSSPRSSSSGS